MLTQGVSFLSDLFAFEYMFHEVMTFPPRILGDGGLGDTA